MDFEKQPLSQVCHTLVKWYGFEYANIEIERRDDVESGVWITVKYQKNGIDGYVSAQRLDLVKQRLMDAVKKYTHPNGKG